MVEIDAEDAEAERRDVFSRLTAQFKYKVIIAFDSSLWVEGFRFLQSHGYTEAQPHRQDNPLWGWVAVRDLYGDDDACAGYAIFLDDELIAMEYKLRFG